MPNPPRTVQTRSVDDYIQAATRDNTRRTYRGAVEHFEVDWGGVLPTTSEALCRYLAHYADTLAHNTLKTRVAALSQWHQSQGFIDPAKAIQVKKVLKSIRALHPAPVKKATPLAMPVLEQLDSHLNAECRSDIQGVSLRATRDRALIWVGFWRGFRSDEFTRLLLQGIEVTPHHGLSLYLSRSKGDRHYAGKHYPLPVLNTLCPCVHFPFNETVLN
ncbi:site-specific integrase [Salinimonas sediminis]|uniref:Core-binding (CB) domain-containing protein n=1 Tax=Salinimonas sediminis TaxID=2303538 RepID=A0A346NMI1_9ALTE|nr:hypothetical protein [Salinimonas sediminis]AXR06738.1 hypothetical protein D0Y50_10395 [Salinimonas sediminis]